MGEPMNYINDGPSVTNRTVGATLREPPRYRATASRCGRIPRPPSWSPATPSTSDQATRGTGSDEQLRDPHAALDDERRVRRG